MMKRVVLRMAMVMMTMGLMINCGGSSVPSSEETEVQEPSTSPEEAEETDEAVIVPSGTEGDDAGSGDTDGGDSGDSASSEGTDDEDDSVTDSNDGDGSNDSDSTDGDGNDTGNNTPSDGDGDGVADADDAFPDNASEVADADDDGVGDNADCDDANSLTYVGAYDIIADGTDSDCDSFGTESAPELMMMVAGSDPEGAVATEANLYYPFGVAADKQGNFYIADYYNQRIRKVDAAGIITTVAGTGEYGYGGDGGAATAAAPAYPHGGGGG